MLSFFGMALIVTGVAGKLAAGYAPFWFRGNKAVIGVGMVPRGEVGLIFAQVGLASGVFDAGYSAASPCMVIVDDPGSAAVAQLLAWCECSDRSRGRSGTDRRAGERALKDRCGTSEKPCSVSKSAGIPNVRWASEQRRE